MEYSILQLATIAGVSTRTLRYYDQIGLLCPQRHAGSDYRIYREQEIDRLQQILFYKELGFELAAIGQILDDPAFDSRNALIGHLNVLEEKERTLKLLIDTVKKTIKKEEGKIAMTNEEKFNGLKQTLTKENEARYGSEIREKYGDHMVEESNRKFMNLTKEEYDAMQTLAEKINLSLQEAVISGISPDSERGREIAQMHKNWLCYTWSAYSVQAHQGLTEMYLADERFKKYYDDHLDGCAQFLHDAVLFHMKD